MVFLWWNLAVTVAFQPWLLDIINSKIATASNLAKAKAKAALSSLRFGLVRAGGVLWASSHIDGS